MANTNCAACEDLRQDAPSLILNGFTETECLSLQNNTGFNPSSGNDDCTDLNNANDCFIGNMENEVEAYDVCEWKPFMQRFIPNVWTVIKGLICAICGLWTNVSCFMNGMTDFHKNSYFTKTADVVFCTGWSNVNTSSNPATGILVNYNYLHGYFLMSPNSTMAAQLESDADAFGRYPLTSYGGYSVNGIPVLMFTGSRKDNNLAGIQPDIHITTDGLFTYAIQRVSPASDLSETYILSVRSKVKTDLDYSNLTGATVSFGWNDATVRKLTITC